MTDEEKRKGFAVVRAMNLEVKRYRWLVEGLFLEVGLSMLTAKPKSGKSSFARQLAYSVAEGVPFLGKKVKQGDVLFLNLEGPEDLVKEHLVTLGYTEKRGIVHVVHETMPFQGAEGLLLLEETIETLPDLRLIVIDPIHKFLRLEDSDKHDQVSFALERVESRIRQLNLQLMMTSHGKKRASLDVGDSTIGSTAFRGATDTNVFIVKQGVQRIISTEQRRGIAMEPTHLLFDEEQKRLTLGATIDEEDSARTETKKQKTTDRIEQEIWNHLCLLKSPTQHELLSPVKGKMETKVQVLAQMVASGRVAEIPDGKARRYRGVVPMEGAA
jgi:hypothetical protein